MSAQQRNLRCQITALLIYMNKLPPAEALDNRYWEPEYSDPAPQQISDFEYLDENASAFTIFFFCRLKLQ